MVVPVTRDTSKDPKCRNCGERLKPFHYETTLLKTGELYRGNMVEISRKPWWNPKGERDHDQVSLWDGQSFGYAASGFFCSLRCGFEFGASAARAIDASRKAKR